jgi:hypothetical protein
MAGLLIVPGAWPVFDAAGNPVSGATISFFQPGTTTPKPVYSDDSLNTSLGSVLTTNAAGEPTTLGGVIAREWWASAGQSYDIRIEAAGLDRTWEGVPINTSGAGAQTVANIADLRLTTWASGRPDEAFLVNNYFAGDSGGTFRYDATDTTTADNGVTIIVDAGGGRWKRQYSGNLDARWAGCVGDSTATVAGTDNLAAFARLSALGVVIVEFPATATNYYYTTGAFIDIMFRAVGRGQIRTAGGNILPPTYTRIRTPTAFGTNNQNQFDGDIKFVNGAYYAFASRAANINAQYFNKNLIPNYSFSEHEINSGSSGAIAFTTAAILTSSTSVTVSSVDGLSIGQTIGFGQGFTFAVTKVITNIVGLTVSWSGAIGVAYDTNTAITDSPRTMGVTTMWNTASEAYGDTYCNVMRVSTTTSTVRAGQKNIFETRTMGLTGGDVIMAGSWAYGTGIEIQISEGAGAVGNGAITFPLYFDRQSSDTTRGAIWIGTYANSAGPVPCDAVISVANKWKVGLCTVLATNANLTAAVQTAKGQKIAFNATATATAELSLWGNVPGTTTISQRTADDVFETVVNGVVGHEVVPNGTNRDISTPASMFVNVRRNTTSAAITGNSTDANIAFDTEVVDVGNLYSSPTFTAAVAGTYLIALNVTMAGLTSSHTTSRLSLFRSDGVTVARSVINPWALNSGDAVVTHSLTALVAMTAGQTIIPRLQVVGGGLSVTVIGGAQYDSYMHISKVR